MIKLLAAALAATSLCACATMTRGTTQAFTVNTTPIGAKVTTSLGLTCESTPCTFPKVNRNANFSVTVSKDGYKTVTTSITNQTSSDGGWGMAGNVLVGGLIGAGVDASSGAMQDLVPNPLTLVLEAESAPASPAATPTAAATAGQVGS